MKATINKTKFGMLNKPFTLDTEDPNRADYGMVYEDLEDAMYNNEYGYGCDLIVLTPEQIDKIKNGGVLAWDDGEYVHYVAVKNPPENKASSACPCAPFEAARIGAKIISWEHADDGWGAWADLEIEDITDGNPSWGEAIVGETVKVFVPPPLVSSLDSPTIVSKMIYRNRPGFGFFSLVPSTEEKTLKEKIRSTLDQRAESRKEYAKVQPRYDDVFYEGVEALDKMAKEENTED